MGQNADLSETRRCSAWSKTYTAQPLVFSSPFHSRAWELPPLLNHPPPMHQGARIGSRGKHEIGPQATHNTTHAHTHARTRREQQSTPPSLSPRLPWALMRLPALRAPVQGACGDFLRCCHVPHDPESSRSIRPFLQQDIPSPHQALSGCRYLFEPPKCNEKSRGRWRGKDRRPRKGENMTNVKEYAVRTVFLFKPIWYQANAPPTC